jgi:hypothetical protein
MTDNPYAPPTARVEDAEAHPRAGSTPPFFPVSLTKLAVLSFFTLGFYELYWFYKNWHCIRERERSNLWPVARALFAILFSYACFARIATHGSKRGVSPPLAAGGLAAGWVVVNLMSRLPDPYSLIGLFAFVFLLPVQAYANRVNVAESPDADPNARFSAGNWIAIVIGGLVLTLAVIGTLSPPES